MNDRTNAADISNYFFEEDLVAMLERQASIRPEEIAFTYLLDGEDQEANLTFGELARRAREIGAFLQARGNLQDRIVLLYGPGLDYIVAFFGCLYGGAIAVTAYPPDPMRLGRTLPRLEAIIADCDPRFVLTTEAILSMGEMIFEIAPSLRTRDWVATDVISGGADTWKAPKLGQDALAFIQYTSGSTGTPKGVMLSHGNLLANERLCLRGTWTGSAFPVLVAWLPLIHDMGLIAHVIFPVGIGARSVLMSPMDFLTRPFRWVRAMSRYKGAFSAAPNFAYDLSVRKSTPEERATLDLSAWRWAMNGAEPLRADTCARFAETFGPCGFRPNGVHAGYGLAEGTLLLSTNVGISTPLRVESFDAELLTKGIVRAVTAGSDAAPRVLVGCGTSLEEHLLVVDPETRVECPAGRIGEIWTSGPCIGKGYWNRPEETERTFHARLAAGASEIHFLRTGDLGFMHEGEIFIAGRLKDLIIVRGRNHYPQDIERTVEEAYPSIRKGCCAAFSITVEGEERLVVAAEVERRYRPERRAPSLPPPAPIEGERRAPSDRRKPLPPEFGELDENGHVPFRPDSIVAAIRGAVSELHELPVEAVVLLKARSIPKTSSGKIQRRACKAGFLDGSLEELARSSLMESSAASGAAAFDAKIFASADPSTRQSIAETYLRTVIAAAIKMPVDSVSAGQTVTRLGIDSLGVIAISDEVTATTGIKLDTVELLRDVTIQELAQRIASPSALAGPQVPELTARKPGVPVPLSFPQRSFWEFEQSHPGTSSWNMTLAVRVVGPLDAKVLERAMTEVARRHEAMRTAFVRQGDTVMQVFLPPSEFSMARSDFRTGPEATRGDAIETAFREEQQRVFDLFGKTGPTPFVRARLIQTGTDEHVMILTVHHLVLDGASGGFVLDELARVYGLLAAGAPTAAPVAPLDYGDFAVWQANWLTPEALKPHADYWEKRLSEAPPFGWAADRAASADKPLQTHVIPNFFPRPVVEALQAVASREGATLAMVLMTALKACMRRWTLTSDLVVAMPAAKRGQHPALASVVGNFSDNILFRSDFSGDLTFRQALARERAATLDAYEHADCPAEVAVRAKSALDSPLMAATMIMPPAWPGRTIQVGGRDVAFSVVPTQRETVNPDEQFQPGLVFLLVQVPVGLVAIMHFFSRELRADAASAMATELYEGIERWAANPDAPI